jgi:FkbM family methyltransferase
MRYDALAVRNAAKRVLSPFQGTHLYRFVQSRALAAEIRSRRMFEPECELLANAIREGETVVDVGANYGLYSYWLSQAVGPTGRVIGFEPIPYTFGVLSQVISHLGLGNVHVHRKGVGAESGTLRFEVPVKTSGQIAAPLVRIAGRTSQDLGSDVEQFDHYEIVESEVVSLDAVLADGPAISFIKIDIEGAELFAVQGAWKTITTQQPTLLLEVEPEFIKGFGHSVAELVDPLIELGYKPFWWNPHVEKFEPMNIESPFGANYFFVPPRYRDRFIACFDANCW